jgi:hypothetical protein
MANDTTEPKRGEKGSWWTTLPGVVTAIAGLLAAISTLIGALDHADLLHWFHAGPQPIPIDPNKPQPGPEPAPIPIAPAGSVRVDGVEVHILDVRRDRDADGALVQLYYRMTTGSEFYRHDPEHFVQLVSDGKAAAPIWTSAWARDLPPNSVQEISLKFRLPLPNSQSVVFRFGEEHHIDRGAAVLDRN